MTRYVFRNYLIAGALSMLAGLAFAQKADTNVADSDRDDFRDRFGARILKPDSNPANKLALYREMSGVNYLTKDSPPLPDMTKRTD